MQLLQGQLDHPAVIALLEAHLGALAQLTPTDSMHALGIERLKAPDIMFWSAWDGDEVMGCAALKALDARHGEVKSMRTAARHLGRGVGAALLDVLLAEARRRGYARVSLETGTSPDFDAAIRLYHRAGFEPCAPFGQYVEDPNSQFLCLTLGPTPRSDR